MSQKAVDIAKELERIVAANRYNFMKQPSHTGIPRLVSLVEDLARIIEMEERKPYMKSLD